MATTPNVSAQKPSPGLVDERPFRSSLKLRLIATLVTGYLVAGAIIYQAIQQTMVNGPLYREVVQEKDLIADVLPPPATVLEELSDSFRNDLP